MSFVDSFNDTYLSQASTSLQKENEALCDMPYIEDSTEEPPFPSPRLSLPECYYQIQEFLFQKTCKYNVSMKYLLLVTWIFPPSFKYPMLDKWSCKQSSGFSCYLSGMCLTTFQTKKHLMRLRLLVCCKTFCPKFML